MALGGNTQAIPHDAVIKPVKSPTPGTIVHSIHKADGTIIDQGVKQKPAHASTPHTSSTTTTAKVPAWLNTPSLTQPQMDAEATSEANAAIAPQVQGLQGEQATYDAQQKAYQAAMTGFYSALAPYMAGIQGHESDAYNSAAQTMGNIGQGYAGELGKTAAADNASTNAALARGGQAPIAAPGSGLTDAFAAMNGGIQGSSFAAEGAAKAADAANKPAVWAAQGRDSLTEAINKAVAGDQGYSDQIKKVYATVPALRATILKQVQQAEIDKAKLQESVQHDAFNEKLAAAKYNTGVDEFNKKQGLAQAKAAFDQQYKIAGLKLRGQSLQLQADKFARQTLQSDRSYSIALANLGLKKAANQRAALAAQFKLANGGFTSLQLNKFNSILQQGVNSITVGKDANGADTYMATDPNPKNKAGWTKVGKLYERPVTYGDFVSQSISHGVPMSLALDRANKFFPETMRDTPGDLSKLLGITPAEAAAAGGYTQALIDHNKMTGVGQTAAPFDVVNAAKGFLGVKYVWGGSNPKTGLDCSGFLQCVYKKVGVNLPRTTFAQVKAGKPVSLGQLQPGDAIFTEPGKNGPNHVGLYIGNGLVQESPHTGTVNSTIRLSSFLGGGFVAARRYLGH